VVPADQLPKMLGVTSVKMMKHAASLSDATLA
jgi:hypothetical protein